MLSEEEKKAIEYAKSLVALFDKGIPLKYLEEENDMVKKLLNLIFKLLEEKKYIHKELDKQQTIINNYAKENKEKDKQIDLMAKKLNQAYFDEDKFCVWFEKMMGVQEKMDYGYVVDLIKQYFETKVKKGK